MKPSELMERGHAIVPEQHFGNFFALAEVEPKRDETGHWLNGYYEVTKACGLGCMYIGALGKKPTVFAGDVNIFASATVVAELDPIYNEEGGYTPLDVPYLPMPVAEGNPPITAGDGPVLYTLFSAVMHMNDHLHWTIEQQIEWLKAHNS